MELSSRLQEALNAQIGHELYSAHLYLSMAAYFESLTLPGFAHWMRVQHQEETGHALKLFDFVNDRRGRVVLGAIEAPPVDFQSPLDAMEKALEHERKVTSLIHNLYRQAVEESDYAAQNLLFWFAGEQVEEEKSVSDIVDQLKLIKGDGTGLLVLDARLGARGTATT